MLYLEQKLNDMDPIIRKRYSHVTVGLIPKYYIKSKSLSKRVNKQLKKFIYL